MRKRAVVTIAAAVLIVTATAVPALAAWLRSSDPADSVGASLWVDDGPRVARGGWQVTWDVRVTCPRGEPITGRAVLVERDPASIPQLAGEDQGITAAKDLRAGDRLRCTGRRQVLRLHLQVADTVVVDGVSGEVTTYHEPISPTPSARTSASVQLRSGAGTGGFFVQYCAAPNCASESGPRVTLR